MLASAPKGAAQMVESVILTIFTQLDTEYVLSQFNEVVRMLTRSPPQIADMLETTRNDLLTFTGFPVTHLRQTWSTNPLEHLNMEIKAAPTSAARSPPRNATAPGK